MKQCPRCKSLLTKTHSQKMICRVCGFMTRNLQVARDNQQFQQRHHYGKKITALAPADDQPQLPPSQQLKKHYLFSFQTALRNAANILSRQSSEYSNLAAHVRLLWMNYLSVAKQYKLNIVGVYGKYVKSSVKKTGDSSDDRQQKQKQIELKKQEYHESNMKSQDREQFEQELLSRRRRGRKKKKIDLTQGQSTHQQKKVSFRCLIRRKVISLKQNNDDLCEQQQRASFLQFLYHTPESQLEAETLDYIANKYCEYLIKALQTFNLHPVISEAKKTVFKLTHKQLQVLIKMRNLDFSDRLQMPLVLLLEDLLQKWAEEVDLGRDHNLESLLILYKSAKNTVIRPIITQVMQRLMKLVSQQANKDAVDKGLIMPSLSFTLLYSFLYIGSLLNQSTLTINQIIAKCGPLTLCLNQTIIHPSQKINPTKIRHTCAILFNLLNLNYMPNTAGLQKWTAKYATICGLQQYLPEIGKIAEVLYQSYQITKKQYIEDKIKRKSVNLHYEYLEQDIIAKAVVVIFVKLEKGFDRYPYLSVFPVQLLARLKAIMHREGAVDEQNTKKSSEMEKIIEVLNLVRKNKQKIINIPRIMQKLTQYFNPSNKRNLNLRLSLPIQNYSALQHLPLQHMISLLKRKGNPGYTFHPNLHHPTKQPPTCPPLSAPCLSSSAPRLASKFDAQLKIAIDQLKQNQFQPEDLDMPASNYEFFYDYAGFIEEAGRELFVCFAEALAAGECRVKELYRRLVDLERVLVDFED